MDSAIVVLRRIRAPAEESRDMLDGVVKELRMVALAKALVAACPVVDSACRRLVWLVTPTLQDPVTQLGVAHLCVAKVLTELSRQAQGAVQMLEIFIGALCEAVADYIVALDVRFGERRWNPASDVPLRAWCAGNTSALRVSIDPRIPGAERRALAESVVMRLMDSIVGEVVES